MTGPLATRRCDGDGYLERWNDDQSGVITELCPGCPDCDGPVLGKCPHGADLDREFCPEGCRV